jgi:uncharacterized protein YukJ
MPLKTYGVLKGTVINRVLGTGRNPHYQVHVVDDTTDYRIAVNVQSALSPSDVEYLVDSHFEHPFLAQLGGLQAGWHALESKPGGPALDFIRSNLFDPRKMVALPFNIPGPDNDLNEKIDHYILRAMADEEAVIYSFGERWKTEPDKKDKIFGFRPGNGVHDIHMNQANVGRFVEDDGVYQDGAVLLHFPQQEQWVGMFIKFQSQTWHTDDTTGHQLRPEVSGPRSDAGIVLRSFEPGFVPTPETPDGAVRIVAAAVNSIKSPEVETVTLLNATDQAIDLDDWRLLDRDKNAMPLTGTIGPGDTVRITLAPPVVLSNKGGQITLLNADGLRVDGVAYTGQDASLPGYSISF